MMKEFFDKLNLAIRQAELTFPIGNGETKRQMVVEMMMVILPAPRWMPNFVKRWALGLIVDFAIWLLNNYLGREWIFAREALNELPEQ